MADSCRGIIFARILLVVPSIKAALNREGIALEFITQNALLIGLAVGSGLALFWPMLGKNAGGVPSISVTEALMLMNRNKPLVLDVRDAAEFANGHIQGAKHVPVAELATRLKEIEKFTDKPVLVYCKSGMRSRTACTILKGHQFGQLHNLQGGLDAWIEAKMPLVKEA